MRALVIALSLMVWAPVQAAGVYKCELEDGDVVYSDKPCPDAEKTQELAIESKPTDPDEARARLQALRDEARQDEIQGEMAEQSQERDAEWRKEQERRCELARRYLEKVSIQPRLYKTDPETGQRTILGTEQREQEVAQARARVERECGVL